MGILPTSACKVEICFFPVCSEGSEMGFVFPKSEVPQFNVRGSNSANAWAGSGLFTRLFRFILKMKPFVVWFLMGGLRSSARDCQIVMILWIWNESFQEGRCTCLRHSGFSTVLLMT